MKLVLHLIANDLRRLKVWLLLWALVFVVMDGLGFAILRYEPSAPNVVVHYSWRSYVTVADFWQTYLNLSHVLVLVQVLFTFVLTVLLVQGDRLVGTRAFWLTRPIGGGRLLMAKLIAAIAVLIVIPAVISLPWWLCCGFGPLEVAGATLQFAILAAIIAVPAAFAAALADTLARALVWGVLVGAVAGGLEMAALVARSGRMSAFHFGDNTALGLFVLLAFAVAIVAQYVWRREGVALAGAAVVFVAWFASVGFLRPVYPRAFGLHDEQRARDVQVRWEGAEREREGGMRAFIEVTLPESGLLHVAGVMQSWQTGDRGRRLGNLRLDPFANVAGPFLNSSALSPALGFAQPGVAAMSAPSTRRLSLADAPPWLLAPSSAREEHYEVVVALALFEPQLATECNLAERTWHAGGGRGLRILGRSENREGSALALLTTAPDPGLFPTYPTATDPEFQFWCARLDREKNTLTALSSGRQWRGVTINAVMISFREVPIGRSVGAHDTLAAVTLRETARFVREVNVGGK